MNPNNNKNIDANLVINPSEFKIKEDYKDLKSDSLIFKKFVFNTPKSRNGKNHEFELSSNNSLSEYLSTHDIRNFKNPNLTSPLNNIPAFLTMKSTPNPIKKRNKKFWVSTQQFYLRASLHPSDITQYTNESMNHMFSSFRIEYSSNTIDINSYNRIHNLENKDNIQKILRVMPHIKTRHSFYTNENNQYYYDEKSKTTKQNHIDLLTKCRDKNFDSVLHSFEKEVNNYFETITQKHNPQLVPKKSFLDKLKDIFN